MTLGEEPAYPFTQADCRPTFAIGITKRELFAAMLAQGELAGCGEGGVVSAEGLAKWSVECADALLAELAKGAT